MGIDFSGLQENDNTYGNKQTGGLDKWRPAPGENVIRLLPPNLDYFKTDINYFTYVYNNHFVRIGKDHYEVFRCLRDEPTNPRCPACTFFFKHRLSEDEAVQRAVTGEGGFSASVRHIMNVLVLESGTGSPPEGVQTFECGPGVYEMFKEYAANKRYGDIFDAKGGRNMILNFTPKKDSPTKRNKYSVSPDVDTSDVTHLLGDDWKDKLLELESKVPEFPKVDYIHNVVAQVSEIIGLVEGPTVPRVVSAGSPVAPPTKVDESTDINEVVAQQEAENKLPWETDDDNDDVDILEDDDLDF